MTDSTCDLSAARLAELKVECVPLSVQFGDEVFRDGVDLTNREFYTRLRQSQTLPTTSQVNPEEFARRFQTYADRGDQTVGIFLASDISGTCQSAAIARSMVDEGSVFVVDSRVVTFSLGLLVQVAASLRDEGMSAAGITARLTELAPRLRLLAVGDTLKYLKMGGRISAATAMVGGVLGICPIIAVKQGTVSAVGKARGRRAGFRWIAERMQKEPADLSFPVSFGHTDCPEALQECMDTLLPNLPGARYTTNEVGSVVGTHMGPGAAGIAYFLKEN
jgi:DegV family protein with EDD domain